MIQPTTERLYKKLYRWWKEGKLTPKQIGKKLTPPSVHVVYRAIRYGREQDVIIARGVSRKLSQ